MPYANQVRVPKAGELVAGQLRRQIVLGDLKEGDALPSESILIEQFGVSRPTLREAFRILEAESLITVLRGAHGGARVHVPDSGAVARYAGAILQYRGATLEDVYATRTLLESQAAGLLASRKRRGDIARLAGLLAAEQIALDDGREMDFLDADEAFHLAVVELTGNQTLNLLVRMLYGIVENAIASTTATRESKEEARALQARTHRSHAKLLEVMREGNPAEAEAYWHRHLSMVGMFLLEATPAETVLDLMS